MTFRRVGQSYFIVATVLHILMPLLPLPERPTGKLILQYSVQLLSPVKLLHLTKAELVPFLFFFSLSSYLS